MPTPCTGYSITTPFKKRGDSWSLGWHTGVDIAAPLNTPIVAITAGEVIASNSYDSAYGYKVIVLDSNGEQWWYCHQPKDAARVSVGQTVKVGQRLGSVGVTGNTTGPHVHVERRRKPYSFAAANFLDPTPAILKETDMPLSSSELDLLKKAAQGADAHADTDWIKRRLGGTLTTPASPQIDDELAALRASVARIEAALGIDPAGKV